MTVRKNLRIYLYLLSIWLVLLVIQYFVHKYAPGNYIMYVFDSLAPIPAIVLVVVFLVGLFMENRDKNRRKRQLLFLKSCMFRLELRNLYVANFLAVKSPLLTFSRIKTAGLDELKLMREEANTTTYLSLEAMEPVIMEYANARDVWRGFMNMAMQDGSEDIFNDMLEITHFVGDVLTFKELNPGKLYIDEASSNESLMRRVEKVLGDGVRKYLDYVIELKEEEPDLFRQVVGDYELLALSRARE